MSHKYRSENIVFRHLKNQVTVPNFQRKLVWSKSEKKNFIKTLHNGYPFGSILVYKYDENKKYTLIDGLQRYTTILDFEKNPQSYIDFSDYIGTLVNIINPEESLSIGLKNKLKLEIKNSVNIMISEREYKENPLFLYKLLEKSCYEISIDISDKMEQIIMTQKDLEKYVDEYLDIDNISIPTIFFTGDENELANVFENLNKSGKKLTKYQVFAAQWSNYLLILPQEKYSEIIINKVIERYNKLIETREIDIEGYDESKIRSTREINLSEFCYGLGVIILEKMSVFWNHDNEDLANTIGYSTIAIVLDIDIRKLNKIIDNKKLFRNTILIEKLMKEIVKVYSDINNNFENFLKYPGTTNKYESQSAKDYQILSFFASLWVTKFENIVDEKLSNKSRYSKNYNEIKNNLITHYINDIYSGYWSGTGDSKVNNIRENKGRRYEIKVTRESLENTLHEWWKDRQQTSSINFDAGSRTLIIIQSYYDSCEYEKKEKYELEHVIPRKYLQEIYRSKNIPGGSLGNLMLLEKSLNRSKQELSIYDYSHEYADIDYKKLNKRFYPSESDFNVIKKEMNEDSKDMTKIKDIIDKRGGEIINNLLNNMVKEGDLLN